MLYVFYIECNNLACPSIPGWDSILENMRQERSCGQNKEYRYCETSGVWGAIDSSECCMFSLSFIYF